MKPFLIALILLGGVQLGAGCAVLKAPFHTSQKPPKLTLESDQIFPGKVLLKLHAHAPNRMGTEIEILRAIGEDDFQIWKSIKVSDFTEQLQGGLTLVDSKLAYGEEAFYQARSMKEGTTFFSDEISLVKVSGPSPPENLRTVVLPKAIKIEWNASDAFSHVLIYRRNIVEDSPLEIVSNLVAGNVWVDHNVVPNGVYSYQIVSAKLQDSALVYGTVSEPLYVTVE